MKRPLSLSLAAAAGLVLGLPAAAQPVGTVDPNVPPPQASRPAPTAVQGEMPGRAASQAAPESQPVDPGSQEPDFPAPPPGTTPGQPGPALAGPSAHDRAAAEIDGDTVPRKDVFTAAEGVFGKGAKGLGDMIEHLLRKEGEPNAYITGREAGGAFILGVRYGSGTLHHQIEGDRPIYWTGPSIGFDWGGDANKVFVLVYNLHDSQRIFKRFPAAEGHAYVIGGFTASYLRSGDTVLIPVRLGVGARLGINAGYMKFSQKNRWVPF